MSVLEKRPDNDLIELLLRHGHVAFNNQTDVRAPPTTFESKQSQKSESLLKCGGFTMNSPSFNEDEATSWSQEILNNSVNKEFSDFFYGMSTSEPGHTEKAVKEDINGCDKLYSFYPQENAACPSNYGLRDGNIIKFSKSGMTSSEIFGEEASGCRKRTILTSICGKAVEEKSSELGSVHDCLLVDINEPVIASSSGGSGFSFVRTANHGYKRKERTTGKSEGQTEEAEYESAEKSMRAHKLESGRRSRAAEVHNLSERRRRDRINEKMRELQDLIPHSNKIDKVSVLDEAIEYLKSLQLQLQSMWMRNGMVPMLFAGIHRHMPCMALGVNHTVMSPQSLIQHPKAPSNEVLMPGTSILNQTSVCPLQDSSSISFATQMQNFLLPVQNSDYVGFPQMQVPQATNMSTYGQQMI